MSILTLNFEASLANLTLCLRRDLGAVQHLAPPDHQGVTEAILAGLEAVTQSDDLIVHQPHQLHILRRHHTLESGVFPLQDGGAVELCEKFHDSRH